jgi:hypothetical protein
MKAELHRIINQKEATAGALYVGDEFLCFTLEPEWKDNVPFYSCIPTGEYECKKVFDRKIGKFTKIAVTFEVMSVPCRTGILFHCGNTHKDTQGCIILGTSLTKATNKQPFVSESMMAFKAFTEKFKDTDSFILSIK